MGLFITFGVAKLVFISVAFLEDVVRIFTYIISLFTSGTSVNYPSRRKAITQIGLGIAAIPFASFLYGMFKTRYDFKVFKEILEFDDLPKEFDGLKVVQFSDFHAGSLDDIVAV